MGIYVVRRILQLIPILFGISVVLFLIMRLTPGNPFIYLIGPRTDPTAAMRLLEEMGYTAPLPQQYLNWLKDTASGNLGFSIRYGRPVTEMIAERLGPTLMLMGFSLGLAIVVSIPMGILAALRQYSVFDYSLNTLAFAGISVPSFFLGLLAMYVFSLKLQWFPLPLQGVAGTVLARGEFTLVDRLPYLVLPVLTLSVRDLAALTRFTRSSMLEVVRQDYVRTARAKGMAERVVVYKHALRNALLPIITLLGISLPSLVGGALIVETIFSWPGLGQMAYEAVISRDYPVIMTINLLFALAVLLGNLIADILYAVADPRIRYS